MNAYGHVRLRRRRERGTGRSLRRTAFALLVAVQTWLCAFNPLPFSPLSAPSLRAQPAAALADEPPPDESVDFYQYTDEDGVIHFLDRPDKIPHRYRDGVIVRKDTPAARQTTRVQVVDHQILVPVSVRSGDSKVQALLLLDTGASITCISEELAARLNIEPGSSRPATARLADGRTIDIRVARVDSVAVGSRIKSPVEIGILPHSGSQERHDGLLGLDFLGDFQYQLDLANEMIRWQ